MRDLLTLPSSSGAYRWFYADVSAGDYTAVFIFMVGAVFSPRYSAALGKGGRPLEHSAVNFALYERSSLCLWVLSEYETASVEDDTLRIGRSRIQLRADGSVRAHVVDRTAPWGVPAEAWLELQPTSPRGPELALVDGQPHWWQPLAPMARATVTVPGHELELTGAGYHDTNRGQEPLGGGLEGWRWTRLHRPGETWVDYEPAGHAPTLRLHATTERVNVVRAETTPAALSRTGWGLSVPRRLAAGGLELPGAPSLLETSPFYARLEARDGDAHALGEVADFNRFHRPYVRWMAHFRTRFEETGTVGVR